MERTEVLDMMGELKLYGMRTAYDETLATALEQESDFLTMKSTMDDMQARLKAVEQRLFGGLISLGETKAKPPNLTKGKK